MKVVRRHAIDAGIVGLAIGLQYAPLPARWIEGAYANGMYAALARTFVPLANAVPFNVGDVFVLAIVAGTIGYWFAHWRTSRGSRVARVATIVLRTAGILAAIVVWFDVAWALNYRRVPVVRRVAFAPARVNPANVRAFSASIVRDLNVTAAHAHTEHPAQGELESTLATAFEPVVRRLGDRYDVIVSRPKSTLFNWWFSMAGIGGQWDPFAYETIVNADFLPFERPFAIAHEWGHVAGFGDESDANYIAALTTLRSSDPLIRYSGLLWVYGFLPDADRRALPISRLVRADLIAARDRFLRTFNPKLYSVQWFVYDKYLRANRVSAGVVSYSLFVELLVGTPLDHDGLPYLRAEAGRAGSAAVR